ncbi:hypothetical protein [Leisingera sp. NJS201]|uniref:hypothetical protein n=1 Tax=Leisingera sp. NJS201 TaxID=2508306 RepID=UPI0026CF99A5
MTPPFASPGIEAAFDVLDPQARAGLLALRGLIFDTAAQSPEAGRIEEALRWGQPSYLTPSAKPAPPSGWGCPRVRVLRCLYIAKAG